MRIVLADLKASEGFVSKDTVAGGYGSRLTPFSKVTRVYCYMKKQFHDLPSVQMAYLAAICARRGHDVAWTRGELLEGDVAVVLSSLVDYRREIKWADAARQRGLRVGFVGLAASKLPELFMGHADFLIRGEPESSIIRLAEGCRPEGVCQSDPVADLDTLPFPRWDLVRDRCKPWLELGIGARLFGMGFPLLASRSCPEFCTYCPHRILAGYRARTVGNIIAELEELCDRYPRPYVIFRDPLFTEQRERCLALCEEIVARSLNLRFECETRLDRLDDELLDRSRAAGLRAITFGVEAVSPETLRKVGRRPIPEAHQRRIVDGCTRRGIETRAFYVFGFLGDDWNSISATIDYAIELGSTFAQFKLLTPYPGTPLWKQLEPSVYEQDWQKFDGYTPTFKHPTLSPEELRFLLGAAYSRFYVRPSYLANYLRIRNERLRDLVQLLDKKAFERHARIELAAMSRTVTC